MGKWFPLWDTHNVMGMISLWAVFFMSDTYIHIYICTYVSMHSCMWARMHAHMGTHTHTPIQLNITSDWEYASTLGPPPPPPNYHYHHDHDPDQSFSPFPPILLHGYTGPLTGVPMLPVDFNKCQCRMSNVRKAYVTCHYIVYPPVTCH